jgi:alkylation response protein AidB-like acyl-CoA dehydrogenase
LHKLIQKKHKGINAFIVEKGWEGFEIGKKKINWESEEVIPIL